MNLNKWNRKNNMQEERTYTEKGITFESVKIP